MSRLDDLLLRRLHRLADGELRGAERREVENAIANRSEVADAYRRIVLNKTAFQAALEAEPSPESKVTLEALRGRIQAGLDGIDSAGRADVEAPTGIGEGAAPDAREPVRDNRRGAVLALVAVAALLFIVFGVRQFGTGLDSGRGTEVASTNSAPVDSAPGDPTPVESGSANPVPVNPGHAVPGPLTQPMAPRGLTQEVAHDVETLRDEQWSLERKSRDGAELEAYFAEQGIAFPTRVFDLAMMDYQLEGGVPKRLGEHPAAAFAYLGPEGIRLLCQMFPGDESELPPGARVSEANGITFYSYDVGCVAMTFWREGEVLCVLASMLKGDAVLQLAIAKAMQV